MASNSPHDGLGPTGVNVPGQDMYFCIEDHLLETMIAGHEARLSFGIPSLQWYDGIIARITARISHCEIF